MRLNLRIQNQSSPGNNSHCILRVNTDSISRDADKLAADVKFLQSEHEEQLQNAAKEHETRVNDLQEQLQAAYDKVCTRI